MSYSGHLSYLFHNLIKLYQFQLDDLRMIVIQWTYRCVIVCVYEWDQSYLCYDLNDISYFQL